MTEAKGFYWVCYGDDREMTIAEYTTQGWFLVGMEEPVEVEHMRVLEFISPPRLRD